MIRKSKQFILFLIMTICLSFLTACGTQDTDQSVYLDQSLADAICEVSEEFFEEVSYCVSEDAEFFEEYYRSQRQTFEADAISQLAGVRNDTGDLVSIIGSEAAIEDDESFVCTVNARFEKRDLEFKIYFDFDGVPTHVLFTPYYTLGEKMQKAFLNMIMGMGLVFIILVFLSFVIRAFKFINILQDKLQGNGKSAEDTASLTVNDNDQATAAASGPEYEETLPADVMEEEYVDDLELTAVIAAAIAAAEDIPADGLKVRSIRRAAGSKWKN